jgi:F-type H+-transporting ATPase subunit b
VNLRGWLAALAVGALCASALPRAVAAEGGPQSDVTETAAGGGEAAAEGRKPEIQGKSLAFQLLNFGVLVGLLIKFGGPPVSRALAERSQQLKTDLESAAKLRASAQEKLNQQEARLAGMVSEVASIRSNIQKEADAEKARLIAQAEERAKRTREETRFQIAQQIKEAEARLRREVALAAIDDAEKLVRGSLNAADQQRLLDVFVAEVDAGAAPAPGNANIAALGREQV